MRNPTEGTEFQMDAISMDLLATVDAALRFPYVLSNVWACPGSCGKSYALMIDAPVALEVEMGIIGQKHLACLAASMKSFCTKEQPQAHLRTDGETVWVLKGSQFHIAPESSLVAQTT